jgi:hypothetical protein
MVEAFREELKGLIAKYQPDSYLVLAKIGNRASADAKGNAEHLTAMLTEMLRGDTKTFAMFLLALVDAYLQDTGLSNATLSEVMPSRQVH